MIDLSALSMWEQALAFIVILCVANFVTAIPRALSGIHHELKRRNDREDGRL